MIDEYATTMHMRGIIGVQSESASSNNGTCRPLTLAFIFSQLLRITNWKKSILIGWNVYNADIINNNWTMAPCIFRRNILANLSTWLEFVMAK